jgi:hypothetical protein
LFEINIPPLQTQKYQRELELIVQECVLITIRESIPVETILKAYMDETIEEEVIEEIKEQMIEPPPPPSPSVGSSIHPSPSVGSSMRPSPSMPLSYENVSKLKFDDNDHYLDTNNNQSSVNAPKTIDRLEEISNIRATQRRVEQENDQDDERITISNNDISLDNLDIQHISLDMDELPDLLKDEIETLN